MGAAAAALAALALALPTGVAHAESRCTGITDNGGRFSTCFDLGNRFSVTAGSDGFGGSIALRHIVRFDEEPDLVWKLEHDIVETTHAVFEDRFTGVVYRGRFIRHARDGHIVIPLGTPKKVFLPFDIGAYAEAGSVSWRPGDVVRVGMIKTAALIDIARSRTFRRRFAFGPAARWDVELDRDPTGDNLPRLALADHVVAPFSTMVLDLYLEAINGRTAAELRVEAGSAWRTSTGWTPEARVEAALERIVLAINDRPISLTLGVRYETATDEAIARVGARIVLFDRRDERVNLSPLAAASGGATTAPPPR